MKDPVVQAGEVTVRHIVKGTGTGQVTVLGATYVPQAKKGTNGRAGFQKGQFERRVLEEGTATLVFPNAAGDDGTLHRDRFEITTNGQPTNAGGGITVYEGGQYRPTDEWFEVYWEGDPDPLFVGTPTRARVGRGSIELTLADGLWTLKKVREMAAGFWAHAPRDVLEHYSKAWYMRHGDDFDNSVTNYAYFATELTSLDGRYKYKKAASTTAGQLSLLEDGYLKVEDVAEIAAPAENPWRVECRFRKVLKATGNVTGIQVVFPDTTSFHFGTYISGGLSHLYLIHTGGFTTAKPFNIDQTLTLSMEARGRWLFCYANGQLVFVNSTTTVGGATDTPDVLFTNGGTGDASTLESLSIEVCVPYLMRGANRGDAQLPGAPTDEGLVGTFYNDADLTTNADEKGLRLRPTNEPYTNRLDNRFDSMATVGWQPVGAPPANNWFSARWTGSIWLDLENHDVRFKVENLVGGLRMWVGDTNLYSDAIIDTWYSLSTPTSVYMRTLFGEVSGWYPVVIDFHTGAGAGEFDLKAQLDAGTYYFLGKDVAAPDPSASRPKLSPLGVHNQKVRYDSHYDAFREVAETHGYQFTCEPKSLESGQFPGELLPVARVGRDTAHVLTVDTGLGIESAIDAEGVADVLIGEAASLSDDNSATATRLINFDEADQHMFMLQEFESSPDITFPALLEQRLRSILALRGAPWEQVGAQPGGIRKLVDSFPVTGTLAEMKWTAGDGIRLELPEIGVHDASPRQILGASRSFVPEGLGALTIAFRQRPKNFRETLRKMTRQTLLQGRNYQGQNTVITGSYAITPSAGAYDDYSLCALPVNAAEIIKAELRVVVKGDTSTMTIEVNGTTTGKTLTLPGTYDVTEWAVPATSSRRDTYARLTGGTGGAQYILELTVRLSN